MGIKRRTQIPRESFNKDEECFRGQMNKEDSIPQPKAIEFSDEASGPHLLFLSSSCSVYTVPSAACILALPSPHFSFRLWGPAAAHSSLGGNGGNGRVFALMN